MVLLVSKETVCFKNGLERHLPLQKGRQGEKKKRTRI